MSGALLVAQETAAARVQTLSPLAAARLMKNPIDVRRGVIRNITLIAPLLETNKYLVVSLPRKVLGQLNAHLASLPPQKREPFVNAWVSKNNLSLIMQHAKAGSPAQFDFKVEPVPSANSPLRNRPAPAPPRLIPRPTQPVRRRTIDIAQPPSRPREVPPALKSIPASLRPVLKKGGYGNASMPFVIQIPVPSEKREGSSLYRRNMRFNVHAGETVVPVSFRLEFTSSKTSGTLNGHRMARALGAIVYQKLTAASRLAARGGVVGITEGHVVTALVRVLKHVPQSDVRGYMRW